MSAKHDSEPAKRARANLLRYLDIALPNGARGEHATAIEGIVDDVIDAAIGARAAGTTIPAPSNPTLADYEALASGWLHYCTGRTSSLEREPLGVVLLAGLCEPAPGLERLTGDLLADVLGAVAFIVARWRGAAQRGGGGCHEVDVEELRALERRLDVALDLRRRERGGAL